MSCVCPSVCLCHHVKLTSCESGVQLWLQGEAVLQTHSFRDAEPQQVIPTNTKKMVSNVSRQLRLGITISLTPNDPLYLAPHGNSVKSVSQIRVNMCLEIR